MRPPPRVRRRVLLTRGGVVQGVVLLAVIAVLALAVHNVSANMAARNIDFGFAFLTRTAGFDIPFHIVDWALSDTYGRALLVSGVNTLLAAGIAVAVASVLGLLLGLMRLSGNPLAAATGRGLVDLVRTTPQLLQIVFWYVAILQVLPSPRQSMTFAGFFLNVRGLFLPAPRSDSFGVLALLAVFVLILPRLRLVWKALAAITLIVAGVLASGWDWPSLQGFNFVGGYRLPPELLALVAGIAIYTSAFIAEIVRGCILGVPRGQGEAARSLGLSGWQTMRLVVLPQALRTMIPPLTSQYLNVIKSTTLGAAIAFPEILQIFARTVLNQSGRAIEVMILVLGVFLAFNLLVSASMNAWNRRIALIGR